jgi:galactokinase
LIASTFADAFGSAPTVVVSAPGRVNLLGEHTDYNGGLVLPTAIPQRTSVALAHGPGDAVHIRSTEFPAPGEFRLGSEARTGTWVDYASGVTAALAATGVKIGGFSALVDSDVPVGSGLSSSAAFEVALLRGLRALFGLALDDVGLAKIAHDAEVKYVGIPVGLLDQMASSLADTSTALLLDTRTLQFERIPLPADVELAIVDSGVTHHHGTGQYRVRREECAEAARLLGVSLLGELGPEALARVAMLPEPFARRARHVITETERVRAGARALRDSDTVAFGREFWSSHASQRDDFEVSVPEVDAIVERARAISEVLGARLTGGGFGGAVVVLTRRGRAGDVARRIAASPEHVLVPRGLA